MRTLAANLMRRLGVEPTRHLPRNVLRLRRAEILRSEGITDLIDVGAAEGKWAAHARARGYSGRIFSYEPRGAAYAVLERRAASDPMWTCERLALADATRSAMLHVARSGESSSLLRPSAVHLDLDSAADTVASEEVDVVCLDDVLDLDASARAYLKADVQGMEIDVLNGATKVLEACPWVELELSFMDLYDNQYPAHRVLAWMWDRSYTVAMLETNWRDRDSGDLVSANAMFRRR